MPKKALGELLRQRRLELKLTLKELWDKSGVSLSHLGRIERGDRYPSARVLNKLARPLGFREIDLLETAGLMEGSHDEDLPEFREYARLKYPQLSEILVDGIAGLIERETGSKGGNVF